MHAGVGVYVHELGADVCVCVCTCALVLMCGVIPASAGPKPAPGPQRCELPPAVPREGSRAVHTGREPYMGLHPHGAGWGGGGRGLLCAGGVVPPAPALVSAHRTPRPDSGLFLEGEREGPHIWKRLRKRRPRAIASSLSISCLSQLRRWVGTGRTGLARQPWHCKGAQCHPPAPPAPG